MPAARRLTFCSVLIVAEARASSTSMPPWSPSPPEAWYAKLVRTPWRSRLSNDSARIGLSVEGVDKPLLPQPATRNRSTSTASTVRLEARGRKMSRRAEIASGTRSR